MTERGGEKTCTVKTKEVGLRGDTAKKGTVSHKVAVPEQSVPQPCVSTQHS